MNHADIEQIHHVARLAFLAMSARGVAAAEFESDPTIHTVSFNVYRSPGEPQPAVEVVYLNRDGFPSGGMSL